MNYIRKPAQAYANAAAAGATTYLNAADFPPPDTPRGYGPNHPLTKMMQLGMRPVRPPAMAQRSAPPRRPPPPRGQPTRRPPLKIAAAPPLSREERRAIVDQLTGRQSGQRWKRGLFGSVRLIEGDRLHPDDYERASAIDCARSNFWNEVHLGLRPGPRGRRG